MFNESPYAHLATATALQLHPGVGGGRAMKFITKLVISSNGLGQQPKADVAFGCCLGPVLEITGFNFQGSW